MSVAIVRLTMVYILLYRVSAARATIPLKRNEVESMYNNDQCGPFDWNTRAIGDTKINKVFHVFGRWAKQVQSRGFDVSDIKMI